jgi:hypothetical protein
MSKVKIITANLREGDGNLSRCLEISYQCVNRTWNSSKMTKTFLSVSKWEMEICQDVENMPASV